MVIYIFQYLRIRDDITPNDNRVNSELFNEYASLQWVSSDADIPASVGPRCCHSFLYPHAQLQKLHTLCYHFEVKVPL